MKNFKELKNYKNKHILKNVKNPIVHRLHLYNNIINYYYY